MRFVRVRLWSTRRFPPPCRPHSKALGHGLPEALLCLSCTIKALSPAVDCPSFSQANVALAH